MKIVSQAGIITTIEYRDHLSTASASMTELNHDQLNIFPNPTTSNLTIQTTESELKTIEISNLNGKILYTATFTDSKIIPVSKWPKGAYFLKIIGQTTVNSETFIVK